TVAFKDTSSMEINLQNLLLGNIIDKTGIGYELTVPVFLNAPHFLNFDLKPFGSKTFQQKISLFSLVDEESEYYLTLFIIIDEKHETNKEKIFFKHKDKWRMSGDKNNTLAIRETNDFKILPNESFKTEKSVILFYSRSRDQ
ncbi:hypothetical protein CDIK_3947, partial [Cucumispora dikerogammari]